MSPEEITAAYNSVVSGITELTSLFGGNIKVIFAIAAVLVAWGVLAYLVRRLTNIRQ